MSIEPDFEKACIDCVDWVARFHKDLFSLASLSEGGTRFIQGIIGMLWKLWASVCWQPMLQGAPKGRCGLIPFEFI